MKKIPLTQGKYALVDDEDFERINTLKWKYNKTGYAVRNQWSKEEKRYIGLRMHRMIMHNPVGFEVDHKDGNGLNNQKSNLRIATHSQNLQNTKLRSDNTSGYKGIYWHKQNQRWYAHIFVNGKNISLKGHDTKELASQAYKEAAIKYYGEFARVS